MKKIIKWLTVASLMVCGSLTAASTNSNKPLVIKVVNFKYCVENSKVGKQEQSSFEAMKKQMETILEDKEKTLNDMAEKFNDPDYLDSLSPEAETDLKRKFRALSQEITQQQNQYFQTLNQTNVKVVQKLTEMVTKASKKIAEEKGIDIILTEESIFFSSPDIDISNQVIAVLDEAHEKEPKEKNTTDLKLP
ncbi:Outer membrane protein [Candidatus Rubidus massiliensis]|nr:MAG: hypothetical protein BGO10_05465 [Chlamydia sp. 32-24]CDZ80560.1 Outer membrane protein [Candidatus Rubidus massiliensis]